MNKTIHLFHVSPRKVWPGKELCESGKFVGNISIAEVCAGNIISVTSRPGEGAALGCGRGSLK